MAQPNSKQTLIDYAFRTLGAPVVEINVDHQQALDRLDDALQFFSERHYDGVERAYFSYNLTEEDIANKYLNTNNLGPIVGSSAGSPTGYDILSVLRIFPFGSLNANELFDIRYQLALNDVYGINTNLGFINSTPIANFDLTKRYIRLIEMMFDPERTIRFNKVTNKIYIETDWTVLKAGTYLAIEAYVNLDPDKYPEIYNDRMLKKYFTALIKRQWGANLSKFDGVALPGGVQLRGGTIFGEAEREIAILEEQIISSYELPPDMMTG
jgi:hypothetical protein